MAGVLTTGMDISDNSGEIKWNKVDPKLLNFVFARASKILEGQTELKDKKFGDYWAYLNQHKIPCGAYMRCHPSYDPAASMRLFFSMYTPKPGDIVPTLDIEDEWDGSSHVALKVKVARIREMVSIITARLNGQKPMLYTKKRVWDELGNPTEFSDCPLWVLDYHSAGQPILPTAWKSYAFWQSGENIKNPPVIADYDPDVFNGPASDIAKYCIKSVNPAIGWRSDKTPTKDGGGPMARRRYLPGMADRASALLVAA